MFVHWVAYDLKKKVAKVSSAFHVGQKANKSVLFTVNTTFAKDISDIYQSRSIAPSKESLTVFPSPVYRLKDESAPDLNHVSSHFILYFI